MKKLLAWLFGTKKGLATVAIAFVIASNSNNNTSQNTQTDALQLNTKQDTEQTINSRYQNNLDENANTETINQQQKLYQESSTYKNQQQTAPQPTNEIKYYTNSKGNTIQSPTYYNSAPSGATAKCNDGTYSFSQSRRGTCSHHGGVAQWL
ncbi:MAG: sh3 type 3 domain protein [Candidatus Peregrinibacteria bacterium GW2011_GWF2_33_10]|nr:MAG: sh3 type 3 domain protein [Candidatus Peregrinibacteria bacterium GW2011_GWF2_33_10]OGJ45848.1 MAG: hypothetical protein A2263_03590 [Candidatus Peregrinibacteria bacterium RIFOXYA2_FULL_33_21]OGJ46483.1 MAG: hypothetical protein A2272_03525 [Candidatus Peregrinibacteria bacterium RIFOXYA12_FULL_33_12]OGJ51360.1 MAG: hypothetical protein A2307_02305 [Candidatus Peregrinibacteria bacterium RIFOXYB2_FULL_33_20]